MENQDVLSPHHFEEIAKRVHRHTGIRLPEVKKHMVEGRLRKRVKLAGRSDLKDYCRYLFDEGGFEEEFSHLVDVVTTNKTDFFREPEHFDILQQLVPALLSGHRERRVKVWSAASSNGAEAYSIAMVLAELAAHHDFSFSILATDICTKVLTEGRRAIYSAEMLQPVPDRYRRFLMRSRSGDGLMRIVPELRRAVTFAQLNLMDAHYPAGNDFDVIFLRNVLIYFNKQTQEEVLARLTRHLGPGGCVFVGHTEAMVAGALPLKQLASAVFALR